MKHQSSEKGLTLVELLVVVNTVVILAALGSIVVSEYTLESKCLEVYNVLPQIIHSQTFHYLKNNDYYAADHSELKSHGVDLSEMMYFAYSTFPDGASSYSIKADATEWAPGGWVLYNHRGDPTWSCDGVLIQREWLPE